MRFFSRIGRARYCCFNILSLTMDSFLFHGNPVIWYDGNRIGLLLRFSPWHVRRQRVVVGPDGLVVVVVVVVLAVVDVEVVVKTFLLFSLFFHKSVFNRFDFTPCDHFEFDLLFLRQFASPVFAFIFLFCSFARFQLAALHLFSFYPRCDALLLLRKMYKKCVNRMKRFAFLLFPPTISRRWFCSIFLLLNLIFSRKL